ncbi:MAG: DUF5666 domain-containing protein [Minisyncoccia bacterium]
MKKITPALLAIFLFVPLIYAQAFSGSGINVTKDGLANITDTKVMMIAGSTLYTRMYWGEAYVRLLIRTNKNTKFFRGTGEPTTIGEISEGDYLDVSGQLDGSSTLTLTATSVKNSSVQKKQNTFSGKVLSVDLSGNRFVLNEKSGNIITVVATSTTRFVKGNRVLDLAHIIPGDTITKVAGDYNITTKTIVADSVVIYVNLDDYKPKNFQGILKGVDGTTIPTSITVLIDGKLYTVNITSKTNILNKNRGSVSLNRFVIDDIIRIYGAVREVDEPIIDEVLIVRNLNL